MNKEKSKITNIIASQCNILAASETGYLFDVGLYQIGFNKKFVHKAHKDDPICPLLSIGISPDFEYTCANLESKMTGSKVIEAMLEYFKDYNYSLLNKKK